MQDYHTKSDETLLSMVLEGDGLAEEELLVRYSKLVRACAHKLFLSDGGMDDLVQEGMIALHAAIVSFNNQYEIKFSTYAERCIRNRQCSAIKSANRENNTPLNTSLSIEELSEVSDSWLNHLCSGEGANPEELLIARENVDELNGACSACLSVLEQKVLALYLEGFSYRQIGNKLSKPEKSVDNAVQRIRRKLAHLITQA